MPDSLPTIWKANAHTLAKHRILSGYLKAWMPILARLPRAQRQREILFVDGFAGPGVYAGGEDGSPVIAIKTALEHSHSFPVPVSFLFVEEDKDRFDHLSRVIGDLEPQVVDSHNIHLRQPRCGDCNSVLREELDKCEAQKRMFGPALVFLDQFGYSAVEMELIGRIMKNPNCEVFSYMNWNRLNPYMSDKPKWPGITRAFENESWKACLDAPLGKREERFLELYIQQLKLGGNSRFIWHFAMCGEGDQLLYWLFFCTNSIRGLEEMKKAMFEVDDNGSFRFSDGNDRNQLSFLDFKGADQDWLAEHLHKRFVGEQKTVGEVKEHVLVETPCYLFRTALIKLETQGRLKVFPSIPKDRKKGDFADESMMVEFVKVAPPPVQQKLF